jgi:hypothetical protein
MENGKQTQSQDVGFLDESAGQGYEGVKTNIPRIKILHFTSPEVLPGDEHVEGAVAGSFFNTVTKRVYGQTIEVIPVKALDVWLEFLPQDKGGGFRGRHAVGSLPIAGDIFSKAYTTEGNEIQEATEFYCLVVDEMEQGLVLLSLTGSSIKHGRSWATRIATVKLPSGKIQPFYGSAWKLTTALNQNNQGKWFTIGVKNATNVERTRFITKDEFEGHVKPSIEFCGELAKALLSGSTSSSQAALPPPEESAF